MFDTDWLTLEDIHLQHCLNRKSVYIYYEFRRHDKEFSGLEKVYIFTLRHKNLTNNVYPDCFDWQFCLTILVDSFEWHCFARLFSDNFAW